MDTIDRVTEEFFPGRAISTGQRKLIKWIFNEDKLEPVLHSAAGKLGLDWVDAVVESLQLRFEVHCGDYDNIPAHGPLIVISNHPTVVDGLALINTISKVRKDIKIIANHALTFVFPQIKDISIGISNMHGKMSPRQFKEMSNHLQQGGVLLICPAGRLASMSLRGIKESRWHPGFLHLAARTQATLLPVHITGVNSFGYYLAALTWRPLSNMMIFREIAGHQGNTLRLRIGQQIGPSVLNQGGSPHYEKLAADFRSHVLRVGRGKPGLVRSLPMIAGPEKRKLLINALNQCEILKTFGDGKCVYLYQHQGEAYSPILQELGRLREVSYRTSGTGTGKKRDNDIYDVDYYHVILWDPREVEIVGAYRIAPAGEQIAKRGLEGLYSHSLFKYKDTIVDKITESFEIGRGFIQIHYQKTNALDALWKGIFCFVSRYPRYKNLLGVLTIPRAYSVDAQQLIIQFYLRYYSGLAGSCQAQVSSVFAHDVGKNIFSGTDFSDDWRRLNDMLRELGGELPWPFKQMARWFAPGGSTLLCFTEDQSFNSIAGLSLCELAALKKNYFSHYIAKS